MDEIQDKSTLEEMKKELADLEKILEAYDGAVQAAVKLNTSLDERISSGALDEKARKTLEEMKEKVDNLEKKLSSLDDLGDRLEALEQMEEKVDDLKRLVESKLNLDFEAMYHNLLEQMNIEAIKIYRNVQAVIVEEDSKQNHVLFGVDGKSDKLKFRMNHVMIISIVSFIVSIFVMILQILPRFGINLF